MKKCVYSTTPISVSVHLAGDNPVFGESVVTVTIEDEAAGPFVRINSLMDDCKRGEIQLDFEQLEMVINEARNLIDAHKKKEANNE